MALFAPLLSPKSAIRFALESVKGTEVLGTADLYVEDLDPKLTQPFVERNAPQGSLGSVVGGALGEKSGSVSFKTPLRGTGTSGLDASIAILFQACGLKKTAEVYNVHSSFTDQKTLSIDCYVDGVLKTLYGAMGNLKIEGLAGNTIYCVFEFFGVWKNPADVALIDPTYSTRPEMHLDASTFTLDSESIKIDKFNLDVANNVILRKCVDSVGGISSAVITNYNPKLNIDPEFDLVAGYDFYGKHAAGSLVPVSLAVTDGTDTMTLALPAVQFEQLEPGDRDQIAILDLTAGVKHTVAGDDAIKLTVT